MRRPRRQPAGICFVVCASLAWAAAARAAAADPSKPFSRVTLDINSGGIEETLPFDIPFYFSGTVDQNVKRFDIAVLERAQGSSSPSCAPGTSIANLKWQHREGSGLDFLVFEPRPLKANRMYCVNLTIIRSVSAEKVKTFRADGATRINDVFKGLEPFGEISVDQAETLRQQLIAAIADPASGDSLQALPGSMFEDTSSKPAAERRAVSIKFRNFLAGVKQAQDLKWTGITNLPNYLSNATTSFKRWAADPAYSALLAKLEQAAQGNESISALLGQRRQTLHDLAALTGVPLERSISGESDPPVPLKEVWDASDVDARVARVRTLNGRIADAYAVFHQLDATPALQTAAALTPAEQQAVRRLATAMAETQDVLGAVIDPGLMQLSRALGARQSAITRAMDQLNDDVVQNVTVVATTVGNFKTRHAWYVGADLGFAWIPSIEETTPYIGTNVYFRPVNKDAPLTGETDSFGRRASAMVGVTVASNLDKAGQRINLFSNRMLLLGGGLRINDSLRVAGGALVFKAPDPNPFVDDTKIKYSFFVSASVDWDVQGTFTSMLSKKPGE